MLKTIRPKTRLSIKFNSVQTVSTARVTPLWVFESGRIFYVRHLQRNNMNGGNSGKRFEDSSALTATGILYVFDRPTIFNNNKQPFLEYWNMPRIAAAGKLRNMFNKVIFSVSGFDHDERAVFEIPEIRKHLRELADEWPYFFWPASLEAPFLCDLIKCMVPNLAVASTDEDPSNCTYKLSTEEVQAVYEKLFHGFGRVCQLDPTMDDALLHQPSRSSASLCKNSLRIAMNIISSPWALAARSPAAAWHHRTSCR